MTNIQYRCTVQTFTVHTYANDQYPVSMYKVDIHCTNLCECPISNIDVQGRHSLYKPMGLTNIQYPCTRQTFTVQTYWNDEFPILVYKVDSHCTNLYANVQYQHRCTRQTFTVQTYANDQYQYQCTRQTFTVRTYGNDEYPILVYKVASTVQTYGNDEYPISMYMVDIHCTNLCESPISNINNAICHLQSLFYFSICISLYIINYTN